MDIHYNAFISYRHHPQDIKVAEAIHRGLERFQVPKALKKKNRTKLRLFRDKEELPITSNLSDDITRALRNSDFLIVICSTHTKESMWVQREIDTFLQTHDHSRVLTVLVDGEPYDTIPSALCNQEQIDPVTGVRQLVPLEPLSCDWRVPKKKAYREELPRLAAALLGCGYDELRQRQRQYRIRRMVTALSIAFSLSLAFTGYVLYNSMQLKKANEQLTDANQKIQNNLNAALTNQSQYLAGASSQNLEAGDRMLAMALAIEALPKQEGERPYVPQAEYALSCAAWAYISNSEIGGVGKLSCDALVQTFAATDARDRMFVADQLGILSVWDLENYSKLGSVAIPGVSGKLTVTPGNNVLFLGTDFVLYCYDADLNLLWVQEHCNEIAATGNREAVLVETNDNTVLFLDTATGEALYPAARISLIPEDLGYAIRFCQDDYDLTKPIVLQYSKTDEDLRLVAWNLQTKQLSQVANLPAHYDIRRTTYTAQGDVAILAISEAGAWNGRAGQMMTYSPVGIRVLCFSQAGKALWESKLTSYSYSDTHVLHTIENKSSLFCQVDNLLAVIDETSGNVLSTCETGATPVWAQMSTDYATLLLEDGSMGVYYYNDNEFSSYRYFKENIGSGFGGKGVYLSQTYSREILVYDSVMDQNWATLEGDYDGSAVHQLVGDGVVAVWNYKGIHLFDAAERTHLWTMERTTGDHLQLLQFTDSSKTLWISNNANELRQVDVQTGDVTAVMLPETTPEGQKLYYRHSTRVCTADSIICSVAEDMLSDAICLVTYDIKTQETGILPLQIAESAITDRCELLGVWNGIAYLWEEANGTLFAANIQTGQTDPYLEALASRPVIQTLADQKTYMISADKLVRMISKYDTKVFETELEDTRAVSGFRTAENIYLLTDAGDLCVYNLLGQQLAVTGMDLYSSFFSNVTGAFDPTDISWSITDQGDLLLNIFRSGNLIHLETSHVRAWIPNCAAYLPGLDQVMTTGKDPETGANQLGVFPCYSTEEIIQMAKDALGTYRLTPDLMEQYGIS